MSWGFRWKPYVSVAQRRAKAMQAMNKRLKQGLAVQPVEIEGRKIARTFWGDSWCLHLESFSDFENRLPRGRTYVRNGSVCHLEITAGEVKAIVSGSELYDVKIAITKLAEAKWNSLKKQCSGQIGSLIELLQGTLSKNIMSVVTNRKEGLFPLPSEIKMDCSCPDWAVMCKHVAAVLYGVGARLDHKPELLFLLRGVDHLELIEAEASAAFMSDSRRAGKGRIAEDDLQDMFGIEMIDTKPSGNGRAEAKRTNLKDKKQELRELGAGSKNILVGSSGKGNNNGGGIKKETNEKHEPTASSNNWKSRGSAKPTGDGTDLGKTGIGRSNNGKKNGARIKKAAKDNHDSTTAGSNNWKSRGSAKPTGSNP